MNIDFHEFGEKGIPIVFLHGWQQNKNSFTSLVPFFYKKHKLFLLSLPGFGKSEISSNLSNSFNYANEIFTWVKSQKLEKIILIGHSFGGKIASIITARHPEIVIKLILIANSGINHPKFWYRFRKVVPTFLRNKIGYCLSSKDYKNAGRLLPIFKEIVKENLSFVFETISTPTLIIWGKNDKELSVRDGIKIHQAIKNSMFRIVNTGHFPFWENPKETAKLITTFIQNDKD